MKIDKAGGVLLATTGRRSGGPFLATFAMVVGFAANGAAAQSVAWEARWDGGLVDSSAYSSDIVVGPSGNVYVAGSILNGVAGDLLTVAWNSAGNLLWYRLKDGLRNSNETAAAVSVGDDGHVFVAGTSQGSSGQRMLLVVYDAGGNELWARTHQDPLYRGIRAVGLAVGADGRVVVVGELGSGSLKTTSLIAYDSDGNQLWERELDLAPSSGTVAFGPTGVLAVAGSSNNFSYDDFLTVAFDGEGNQLWARTRDGSDSRDDTPRALVVDGNGRFVVTGISESAASDLDVMTVVYDETGSEVWATTKGGPDDQQPWSIAADTVGNVFVVGTSEVANDNHSLTFSYDETGQERWAVTRVDGAGEESETRDVTVTTAGDVAITGTLYGPTTGTRALVVTYDGESGSEAWTRIRTPPPGFREQSWTISSGPAGSTYAFGNTQTDFLSDFLTVAYASNGDELWAREEPMIPAADVPGSVPGFGGRGALATGYDGRVYVTGSTFDGRSIGFMTVAYSAFGDELWEARKSTPNSYWSPAAIAVDPAIGNVYVTGRSSSISGYDFLTVAYDRNGTEIWSRTRQGAGHANDYACCIAVSAEGLIVVTGESQTGSGSGPPDLLTVAYESDGNEVWSDEWSPGPNIVARPNSLTVGTTGLIFVGGDSIDNAPMDFLTVAYDASGSRLWSRVRDGGAGVSDYIMATAPTPLGGVATTGATDTNGTTDILTVVYDADGTELWSAIADSLGSGMEGGAAIAVDGTGQVVVTGASYKPDWSDPDFMTVAYGSSGEPLWSRERGGVSGGEDLAHALTIGSHGKIFVTGESGNGANADFLTVAYSPGGYELFEHRYDSGGEDQAYLAVAGPDGSAFVGGVSYGAGQDFFLQKILDESGLFADGFESGDTDSWTAVSP